MKRIVFDVMGSDAGPAVAVAAASQFVKNHVAAQITLVGNENIIKDLLVKYPMPSVNYRIVNAAAVVSATIDNPMEIRHAGETSMVKALRLMQSNDYDFMLTAGPTTGLVAGCVFTFAKVGQPLRHFSFLALVPRLATNQSMVVLDLGAVLQVSAKTLLYYARVGKLVSQELLRLPAPRIGLLNVGTEPKKGLPCHVQAYQLLQDDPDLNFVGNVEPYMAMTGAADVIVCDGYGGNIAFKSVVAALKVTHKLVAGAIKSSTSDRVVLQKMQTALLRPMDTSGLVIGVPSLIFKVPGRSQQNDFLTGLAYGWKISESKVKEIICQPVS